MMVHDRGSTLADTGQLTVHNGESDAFLCWGLEVRHTCRLSLLLYTPYKGDRSVTKCS